MKTILNILIGTFVITSILFFISSIFGVMVDYEHLFRIVSLISFILSVFLRDVFNISPIVLPFKLKTYETIRNYIIIIIVLMMNITDNFFVSITYILITLIVLRIYFYVLPKLKEELLNKQNETQE